MKKYIIYMLMAVAQQATATEFEAIPKSIGKEVRIKSISLFEKSLAQQEKLDAFNKALGISLLPEELPTTRGSNDALLYKKSAPAVVLVVTKEGSGSGAVISNNGKIVTNWHVVGTNKTVGVIFKPIQEGREVTEQDIRIANVVRVDELSDLALLKIDSLPNHIVPLKLAKKSDISVGLDVHAIGHPKGEAWTYTKGIISQYRSNYTWRYGENLNHKATVIQTQTPINPGNSGGPLLLDNGLLIGINSFKTPDSDALNFAVSVQEIEKLLNSSSDVGLRNLISKRCEPKKLFEGRSDKNDADLAHYDTNCDGKMDTVFVLSDDKKEPLMMYLFSKSEKAPNAVILSHRRDSKYWDLSYWDNDLKGGWPLVGLHKNGNSIPYKFVSRKEYEHDQDK